MNSCAVFKYSTITSLGLLTLYGLTSPPDLLLTHELQWHCSLHLRILFLLFPCMEIPCIFLHALFLLTLHFNWNVTLSETLLDLSVAAPCWFQLLISVAKGLIFMKGFPQICKVHFVWAGDLSLSYLRLIKFGISLTNVCEAYYIWRIQLWYYGMLWNIGILHFEDLIFPELTVDTTRLTKLVSAWEIAQVWTEGIHETLYWCWAYLN